MKMLFNYLLWICVSTHFSNSQMLALPATGKALKAFGATLRSLCATAGANGFVFFKGVNSEAGSELIDFSDSLHSCPVRWVKVSASRSMNLKNAIIVFFVRDESELIGILRLQDSKRLSGGRAFFIFANGAAIDLADTFRAFTALAIFTVNVLAIDRDAIVMMSLEPFRENECRGTKPVVVNVYNETLNEWSKRDFLPPKLRNFHKCSVTVSAVDYAPAVMKKFNNETSATKFYGSDVELLRGLSTAMNFTLKLAHISDPYDFGEIHGNHSTGAVSHIVDGDDDVAMGFYFLTYELNFHLSPGYP